MISPHAAEESIDGRFSADRLSSSLSMTKDMPADEALRHIVATCRAEIAKHRVLALAGDDPEGVHQTRVALRRLRAALGLFREVVDDPALHRIDARARRFARQCGPARDVQVFLYETVPDAPSEVTSIGQKLVVRRLLKARRALSGETFDRFDRSLESFENGRASAIPETVGAFARRKLDTCLRRVRRRGRGMSKLKATDLHRLRIATKKLRYAATFLAPVFEARATVDYIATTQALQNVLGALNDRVVGRKVLADIAAAAGYSKQTREPCKRIGKRLAGSSKRDKRRLKKAWHAFKKMEPFWRDPA